MSYFSRLQRLNLSRTVKEVANLPTTPYTKLAAYYMAVGLQVLAGNGEGRDSADKNVSIIRSLVKPLDYKKYGLPEKYFSYTDPKIIQSFPKEIKSAIKKMANDPSVSADETSILKFSVNFLLNPIKNPNYVDRAKKYALTISAAYYRNFTKVLERIQNSTSGNKSNIQAIQTELSELVAKIMGKTAKADQLAVPNAKITDMRRAGGNNLDVARKYAALRRDIGLAYDRDLADFITKSSPSIVPVQDVFEHMKKLGYKIQKLPDVPKKIGIKVGIHLGKLKYYTSDDRPLLQNIPANAKDFQLSKRYDPKTGEGGYLTYSSDQAMGVTRVYTEAHHNSSVKKISSDAQAVSSKIDKVLTRWKKDLISSDPIKKMGATASVMIYMTAMRVGARQNSAASQSGEATYGAISLRPRHVILRPNTIILRYKGKAASKTGIEQQHTIKVDPSDGLTKRLYQNLEQFMKNKKKDDLIFSIPNKNPSKKPIVLSYSAYIQYLKDSGYPAGPHKMRRVRGTNLMLDMLKSEKFNLSAKGVKSLSAAQKEGEEFVINKILTPVAVLLGHKSGTGATLWRTSVKSYVEVQPLIDWFNSQQLRIPKWLPKKAED